MYAHKSFLTSFDFPEKSELQKLQSGNGSEILRFSIYLHDVMNAFPQVRIQILVAGGRGSPSCIIVCRSGVGSGSKIK